MERIGPDPLPPLPFLVDAAREFEDANPDVNSWVYILELETGRHYVGETTDLRGRMSDHSHCRVELTDYFYRPIRLVWAFRFDDEELRRSMECAITDQYIEELGPHGVRGGHRCYGWAEKVHVTWAKPRESWIQYRVPRRD